MPSSPWRSALSRERSELQALNRQAIVSFVNSNAFVSDRLELDPGGIACEQPDELPDSPSGVGPTEMSQLLPSPAFFPLMAWPQLSDGESAMWALGSAEPAPS